MFLAAMSRPLAAMAAVALLSGIVVMFRPATERADREVWTFAETHARGFCEPVDDRMALVDLWRQRTGESVKVELIGGRGLDLRLISLFNSGSRGGALPDLVEVEMGSVGKYFRSPVDQMGFLPLDGFLDRPGPMGLTLRQRLIPGRLSPWTKDGVVFGIPHDVHPVAITYRRDLWDEAGIDPSRCRTWEEYRRACIAFEGYWRGHGHPRRRAMELSTTTSDALSMMLLQRGINLLEGDSTASAWEDIRVRLGDDTVARTLAFYVRFVAGGQAAGGPATPGPGGSAADLAAGDLCAMLTPDWKAGAIRDWAREHATELAGRLAMMPLPRFEPGDHATSTWGGTMIAIPRYAADPERSWALLEFLYFSPEALAARRKISGIVPPLRRTGPRRDLAPDAPLAFEASDSLFQALAEDVPAVQVTPYTTLAQIQLARVLSRAVSHVNDNGDAGLEDLCHGWLNEAAGELAGRIRFGAAP